MNKTIAVTCAIIKKGELFLIARRGQSMNNAGKWEFPGGKVKSCESFEACLHREILEELTIKIRILSPLPTIKLELDNFSIELIPFLCEKLAGEIIPVEHDLVQWEELVNLKNFDFTEADKLLIEYLGSYFTNC